MAKVTEQDVIIFLKEKIATLNEELRKTQSALDAFSGVSVPSAATTVADSGAEEPVRPRRGRKPSVKKDIIKPLNAPAEFDPGLKLDAKVAYVLSQGAPLFNTEIINRLKELEPEKDADKLGKAVMVKLSALHKAGRIKGEKEGRKFKYQL